MTESEVDASVHGYERELGIPVADALTCSPELLLEMLVSGFPALENKLAVRVR